MFWVSLQASSHQMMDGSTALQQLEAVRAAVGLFLLRQQLCSLVQDDSKFLGNSQNKIVSLEMVDAI